MQMILELHRRVVTAVGPIVGRVRPPDLARPTPCADWDVRALLEHMIGQDHGFAAAIGTDVGREAFAPRPVGSDPAAAHAAGAAAVVAAFAAADPDRPVLLAEFGARFPLADVAGFHLVDTLVHGWDVGVALGAPVEFDDDLVAAALRVAEQVPADAAREAPGAPFAPPVPLREAGSWERTLALLGRDPAWRP
ncbi:TIGR03086 family metal-binding protein [Pseudonocardia nigra]|uniref:TIGR03086 family metal-binding protein n=1 Tax=Pseudonocardia nigra TaxID=1921578 RepID=UPI001C5DCA24|nr:TIGR03086 family metal-binding protein [Pseudonocardia nigra]